MALTKRGRRGVYHYDFTANGRRVQGSTGQTNINKARLVEAKVRSDVALEKFGIAPPKLSPLFKEFLEGKFLAHCDQHAKAKRTARFYADKVKRLLLFQPWQDLRLADIDADLIGKYFDFRRQTVGIAAVNGELRTLRKALRLALEWRLVERIPKVSQRPGEQARTFIVSGELETAYLATAPYPLRHVAILVLDLGLRPEEAVSLRKADISDDSLTIIRGKTANARRTLPLTARAKEAIETCSAIWPDSPWLFPGRKGKHLTRGAIDNAHAKLRKANGWPAEFVLYSFRHTFATRLAESGASPFEMIRLLGHYDIRMTQRYVHPSQEGLGLAMKRLEAMNRLIRGEVHEEASEKLKTS